MKFTNYFKFKIVCTKIHNIKIRINLIKDMSNILIFTDKKTNENY